MPAARLRIAALLTAALVAGGVLLAASPAQALSFDGEPTDVTLPFAVAGAEYTLVDRSYGTATRTVQVGAVTGKVPAHYRLTFKDHHGTVLAKVRRGLEQQAYLLGRFGGRAFATEKAFLAAERKALAATDAVANASYVKGIRILSVQSDLESTIGATSDYLDALPAGTKPDFGAVTTVKSSQYPGTATVSGNDATSWTVTVRDTRDGYGEVFDRATGSEAVLRF